MDCSSFSSSTLGIYAWEFRWAIVLSSILIWEMNLSTVVESQQIRAWQISKGTHMWVYCTGDCICKCIPTYDYDHMWVWSVNVQVCVNGVHVCIQVLCQLCGLVCVGVYGYVRVYDHGADIIFMIILCRIHGALYFFIVGICIKPQFLKF